MTAELEALIAKLAAATEGSRQLDCAIRDTLGLDAMLVPPDGGDEAYPYTTSVDAALTLAPPRHRYLIDKRPYAESGRPDGYRAEVYRDGYPYKSDGSDRPTHWGPTAPLAICIASLRARSALSAERG